MHERPILFSGQMVRAILDGRKTQTRRVVTDKHLKRLGLHRIGDIVHTYEGGQWNGEFEGDSVPWSPYGIAGDGLWVRETWADLRGMGFDDDFAYREKSLNDYGDGYGLVESGDSERCRLDYGVKWKPSIHMPKIACRLFLRITDIRVERLQDITEEDALAEGVERTFEADGSDYGAGLTHAVDNFAKLWRSINGSDSWDQNPWVWVVTFHRLEKRDADT